jgi:hypothetical protein
VNNKYNPKKPLICEAMKKDGDDFFLMKLDSYNYLTSSDWLEEKFPTCSWGRINWDAVPNSLCTSFSDDLEVKHLFDTLIRDRKLSGKVNVSWTNALTLPIEVDISLVSKYAEKIFAEDWDTWIYSEQYNWCIEVHHSGEICFGYSRRSSVVL